MYILNTGTNEIELKAKASSYRAMKQKLGVDSLRGAFMKAYTAMDMEFLGELIKCFAADKEQLVKLGGADGVLDECLDNGIKFEQLFSDLANFLNGMGFFGDLKLPKKAEAIEWFRDPMNGIDLDAKLASALDSGLDSAIAKMVSEKVLGESK